MIVASTTARFSAAVVEEGRRKAALRERFSSTVSSRCIVSSCGTKPTISRRLDIGMSAT
jgi:hypothetical protein